MKSSRIRTLFYSIYLSELYTHKRGVSKPNTCLSELDIVRWYEALVHEFVSIVNVSLIFEYRFRHSENSKNSVSTKKY